MTNSIVLHSNLPAINNFSSYKNYVMGIPNLSEEEERSLLIEFKVNNCLISAQKLIMAQLKSVIFAAQQFKNYGLPEEDLVQEGNIGLMKAVKNFNLAHKVRLFTYSALWIKAEMQNYILKNWKIVKISTTKNLKKLFFNFRSLQKEMIDSGVEKNQIKHFISDRLGVSNEEIQDIESYFSANDINIDTDNEEAPVFQLADSSNPEAEFMDKHDSKIRTEMLISGIANLSKRHQDVLKMRFYDEDKKTHKEIAQELGVSSERIRQIEVEALQKLKATLNNHHFELESF